MGYSCLDNSEVIFQKYSEIQKILQLCTNVAK